jgi:hypothetical protein
VAGWWADVMDVVWAEAGIMDRVWGVSHQVQACQHAFWLQAEVVSLHVGWPELFPRSKLYWVEGTG